jgi:DNA-binding response OmpR family regulator
MNSEDTQAVFRRAVNVLLISPCEEDHRLVREILKQSNWQPHSAHTQREAFDFLRENVAPVAICEGELPDGDWREVLAQFEHMQCPPLLVVTSRMADEYLWSEVLNLGGYNVLAKPLNTKELFHVAGTAWMAWKQRWEGRALARTA